MIGQSVVYISIVIELIQGLRFVHLMYGESIVSLVNRASDKYSSIVVDERLSGTLEMANRVLSIQIRNKHSINFILPYMNATGLVYATDRSRVQKSAMAVRYRVHTWSEH